MVYIDDPEGVLYYVINVETDLVHKVMESLAVEDALYLRKNGFDWIKFW